jgi:hypothetical protein
VNRVYEIRNFLESKAQIWMTFLDEASFLPLDDISEQNISLLRTRPTGRKYSGFVGFLPNLWNPRRAFQSVKAEDVIPSLYELKSENMANLAGER